MLKGIVEGLNRIEPGDSLRSDHARVMSALVHAMKAAQNWGDILQVAECIHDVEHCHFRPMLKEAIHFATDVAAKECAPQERQRDERHAR